VTVLSGQSILAAGIVEPCLPRLTAMGMTFGLGPAGYDVRLDLGDCGDSRNLFPGEFMLGATLERFFMPYDVLGVVHDKSTWARQGLALQNTVIEPGWRGFLTLEITNHGRARIALRRGVPIAQVVFHKLDAPASVPYAGRYQNQEAGPQRARFIPEEG
jgi:dCTP deaminase